MTSAALVLPRAATNQTAAAVAFMAAADTGAVAVAGGAAPDGSLTWSCFRGPLGGVAALRQAPVAWDGRTGAGVVWKTALAVPGLSSPVVWNDRVYLTEADEKARAVLGFDARDGRQVWRQGVADGGAGEALPETTSDTGLGAPSPACDASGVYAVFGTGDLAAFGRDGQRRWQVYLRRPAKPYGHASSLWAGNGLVCVQYDQEEDGRLLALDAANGRTVWEVPRGQGPSWSSPLVLPGSDGRPMLLVNGKGVADAYDLAKGTALWEVEGVTGDVAPSSASGDGRIYLVNGGSRLVCYTLAPAPVKAWEYADILPDVASPVAAQGLLFMATSSGGLVCLDAATGKELWHRDYEAGFYASPVVCGAALYALDRAGTMRVVAVERTFREIAACMLGEESDATPAFAGGRIYVRTKKRLWCLGR